tara:strand:- start:97 stop:507 length:411 start_codon:yes stop_codon:yes gene_type:complete
MNDLFIKYGLKKTSFRKELLIFFQSSSSSLTVKKIIKKFASSVDKVSIYRALNSFEKSGLIHKVPDKNNLLRYSLCSSECGPGKHSHDHAHLLCSICDETFCLDDFLLPNIKSHNGYVINNYKIILEGSCLSCQGK